MIQNDLRSEEWREYVSPDGGYVYRIHNPVTLFQREGGSTHRVLDADGIVHIVSGPVRGTVIRVQPRDPANPVQF